MRVVVSGWVGASNLGDELIHRVLLRQLHADGHETISLSVRPEVSRSLHGTECVSIRRAPFEITQSDALVFGGGGLLQDETSAFNVAYHSSRPAIARMTRRPTLAVGLGVGPLRRRGSSRLSWLALGHAEVCVRDRASLLLAREAGLRSTTLGVDLVLALGTRVDSPPTDRTAVSLRPPVRGGVRPTAGRVPFPEPSWLDAAARALDDVAARTGFSTSFVAMDDERDTAVHRAVAARMTSPTEVLAPSLDDVADLIGSAGLVIGQRFHAGVLGVLARRPVVALSYSHKVGALAEDVPDLVAAIGADEAGLRALPDSAVAVLARGPVDTALDAIDDRRRHTIQVIRDLAAVDSRSA